MGSTSSPDDERYVIGRNGVFATLYDRQERRLIVDNSTEEHCRNVRDGLLASREDPRPVQPLVSEYRIPPTPPNFTPLIVRRDPADDGTRWAVLHDPGDASVRRAWTGDGWQMAWALTHDETYCWPDDETALAQARQARTDDDREPDVDGAGRTRESYR